MDFSEKKKKSFETFEIL